MQMNDRDLNLDFVKGFLVVCMVIYHSISCFTTLGYDGTKYVRFVTGSFIFISGYIVAVFYSKKFGLNKKIVCKKLILRGLKLLLIFTFLNIIINLSGLQSHKVVKFDIALYLLNLKDIYIDGNSIYAVFQILVPIAYLLILSPLFLLFHKWIKTILITVFLLLSAYAILNIIFFNLYGLIIGLVGLSLGLLRITHELYCIRRKIIIIFIFCICILLMKFLDKNIITYMMGVIIILKLVYDFSKTQDLTKYFNKLMVMLGQYSLISYIMQIFFLQSIYQLFIEQRFGLGYEAFVILVITNIFTNIFLVLVCLVLERLRSEFEFVNKSYKLIFS
jgi:hypothetical protein